nr:hypothetical protein [Tanacetum cinerariifolium]
MGCWGEWFGRVLVRRGCTVTAVGDEGYTGKKSGKIGCGLVRVWDFYRFSPWGFEELTPGSSVLEHDAEKPESAVNLSPSSSALSGEQDDMIKKKDKGKSPVKYFTGNKDFNVNFKDYSEDSSNNVSAADMLEREDIVYSDHGNVGAEADFNNLETSIT